MRSPLWQGLTERPGSYRSSELCAQLQSLGLRVSAKMWREFQQAEGENVSNLPPRLQRFAAHLSVRRRFGTWLWELAKKLREKANLRSPAHTGHVLTWPGTEVATVLSAWSEGLLKP